MTLGTIARPTVSGSASSLDLVARRRHEALLDSRGSVRSSGSPKAVPLEIRGER